MKALQPALAAAALLATALAAREELDGAGRSRSPMQHGMKPRLLLLAALMRIGKGGSIFRKALHGGEYERQAEWLRRHCGMKIGEDTTISPRAHIMDHHMVTIGRNCSVSAATFITHSGGDRVIKNAWGYSVESGRPIVVGDNCIIGANATILYGVTIGDNCVIGAGSYVSKDVPSGTLVRPPEAVQTGTTEDYVHRLVRRTGASKGIAP